MKYFFSPAALLAFLLGASLWNARFVAAETASWHETVVMSAAAAQRDGWVEALDDVRAARQRWGTRKAYLHIVTAHEQLEKTDALFAVLEGAAAERDGDAFRTAAAELLAQLDVIAELQQLTLRNIL